MISIVLQVCTYSIGCFNVRHARVVDRPARLQRPYKASVHEPSHDMPLGSIHSVAPRLRSWLQRSTLFWSEVVVRHTEPFSNNDMRCRCLDRVERLRM